VIRVVGTDPGTSSLDLLLLVDGEVAGQERLMPEQLRRDPECLVRQLRSWMPLDLVAGPSGYGLPLVRSSELSDSQIDEMSLVRPDQRGLKAGVHGFRSLIRALRSSELPVVFLPGGIHLPSIPAHRKLNTIDMGTADKVAVAALALWFDAQRDGNGLPAFCQSRFALVELGSVFAAVLVIEQGQVVDAAAGTRGPIGVRSSGAWDGEVAYWYSPLTKDHLFQGGLEDLGSLGPSAFRESLTKYVAGLQSITPFQKMYLSGGALQRPEIVGLACAALEPLGTVTPLESLPGAWVKHAAQGAAIVADGLAGGHHADIVAALNLKGAAGSVWNGLRSKSAQN